MPSLIFSDKKKCHLLQLWVALKRLSVSLTFVGVYSHYCVDNTNLEKCGERRSNQTACLNYITLVLLNPDISCFASSVDPDQLASEEAN